MATASDIRAGKAFVELGVDDSPLAVGLKNAEREVKAFGARAQGYLSDKGMMADASRSLEQLGKAARLIGTIETATRGVGAAMTGLDGLSQGLAGNWADAKKSLDEFRQEMASIPLGIGSAFRLGTSIGDSLYGDAQAAQLINLEVASMNKMIEAQGTLVEARKKSWTATLEIIKELNNQLEQVGLHGQDLEKLQKAQARQGRVDSVNKRYDQEVLDARRQYGGGLGAMSAIDQERRDALQKELQSLQNPSVWKAGWQHLKQSKTDFSPRQRIQEIKDELAEITAGRMRANQQLDDTIKQINANRDKALAALAEVNAGQAADEAAQEAKRASDAAAAAEQKRIDQLQDLRIEGIDDAEAREIAAIKNKWEAERREAEAAGQDTSRFFELEQQDLANAYAKYQKQDTDTAKREAASRAEAEEKLQDDLARARIEATLTGSEKARALLDLDRRKAIREAVKAGLDPELVGQLYDLKDQALGVRRALGTRGTFSAAEARLTFTSGTESNAAQKIARATERTARHTETIAQAARNGLAFV